MVQPTTNYDYGTYDVTNGGNASSDELAPGGTAVVGSWMDAAAAGFTDADGLAPTGIHSDADWQAYVTALENKTGPVTSDDLTIDLNTGQSAFGMGGSGDDHIYVTPFFSFFDPAGTLLGGDGNDLLEGFTNSDSLVGGAGNDTLDGGGAGTDTLIGGGGKDWVAFGHATAGVVVDLGNTLPQDTGAGVETLTGIFNASGTAFGDTLTAAANSASELLGNGGDDVLHAAGAHDSLLGGGGADTLTGVGEHDRLIGGSGDDLISFSTFVNTLAGSVGKLSGGDVLDLNPAAASFGFIRFGYAEFVAVNHFDGQAGEVGAVYHAAAQRTVLEFDTNGDGHTDYKVILRHIDDTTYDHITGVDTSRLTTTVAPDHHALVT